MTRSPLRRSVLPGGLRVVTEAVPGVRSAAFGIWVGVGSRDESPTEAGASHFLEHLLFKGTARRDALEIASVMDAVGGELNAFTAHEYTCYYARVLDADLPLAVDVVCDLVTSALVTPEDVESERGVILEEISMHDDDPGDVVHDAFAEGALRRPPARPPRHRVGREHPVADRDVDRRLLPVALPGAVTSSSAPPATSTTTTVVRRIAEAFGDLPAAEPAGLRPVEPPPIVGGAIVEDRPTEQAHLVLGMPGLSRQDDRRYALAVLNNAVGGGMSSRLFQEVRERRGLAYSVYSYSSHHHDTGMFGVYAGCAPGKVDEVLQVCREQLDEVAAKGVTDDEIEPRQGAAARVASCSVSRTPARR